MSEGPISGSPTAGGDAPTTEVTGGDPALIGRTIASTFTIEKFLGGGAMGAVYRARQSALERNVAVKVMHRAVAVDPSFVARFHREAKAASRLDHPNSMRVLAFGEEPDGLLYIAMEFLDGRDLYRVIHEDWPLSNARIGDVTMQALAAIAVAHDMGVIHRDLKPENIMILRTKNDEGRDDADLVKVCDFGIAKITEKDDEPKPAGPAGQKLTTQGLVVGTPEYMSPEQARGEKLDARSDLYSMGVILYQLLTGRTPFTGDTALAVVLQHITAEPSPPREIYPGVHRGLEEVALRAMAKDRAARFQSAREMRNAIRAALEGRPMPVDVTGATTDVALPSVGGVQPGTAPLVIAQSGMSRVGGPATAAVVGSAPTVAGAASSAQMTPLGTAAAPPEAKKSRAGLVVGLALVGALGVGGVIAAPRLLHDARGGSPDRITTEAKATAAPVTATASAPAPSSPTAPTNAVTAEAPPTAASVVDPKAPKPVAHGPGPTPTGPRAPASGKQPEPASPAGHDAVPATTAPAPAPEPAPAPPPATTAAPQPPAPATPVAPQPPPFNAATCKANLGTPRGSGAVNAKDLTLNGTGAAWTSCAQRTIKERPGGPISAVVHLMFSDNRSFRGASCNSCPPPLASCIASSTGRTVSVSFRGGDVTGDPAFDVPVTITCD